MGQERLEEFLYIVQCIVDEILLSGYRASDSQCREVATVLGSIPASSDTVESERRQKKQSWIKYIKTKNSPVENA